jgi:hypothetical protein
MLRAWYFGIFAFVGFVVWPRIIARIIGGGEGLEPLPGVAVSFYAALSVLCLLGLRYPLTMLPLLFLEVSYKVVWLLTVWLPLHFAGREKHMSMGGLGLSAMGMLFLVVVVGILVTLPWPYVVARFVRADGDEWRASTPNPSDVRRGAVTVRT